MQADHFEEGLGILEDNFIDATTCKLAGVGFILKKHTHKLYTTVYFGHRFYAPIEASQMFMVNSLTSVFHLDV